MVIDVDDHIGSRLHPLRVVRVEERNVLHQLNAAIPQENPLLKDRFDVVQRRRLARADRTDRQECACR